MKLQNKRRIKGMLLNFIRCLKPKVSSQALLLLTVAGIRGAVNKVPD